MTKDQEAALRKRARDARAEVRELEDEMGNHNPNWKTRSWRAGHNAINLLGVAAGSGDMMRNKKWGPLRANTWLGMGGEALDIWLEHPALRLGTELLKGLLGASVAAKRSGEG